LAYGFFLASRKLRHYFYDHKITVVNKAPLKDIINNSDATRRVAKWGIELASFDIDSHRHQVSGFGGLHGGLEGSTGDYACPRTRALGDAL
jgi:hypothetical protein